MACPALAAEQRAGHSLGLPLLLAMEYNRVLRWSTFLLLACLAHPVVVLLLWAQCVTVVPVVQFICLARLFSALDVLVYPALLTCGALGSLLLSAMLPLPVYALVLWLAAPQGLLAIAGSFLVLTPLSAVIGLACMRHAIRFGQALCRRDGVWRKRAVDGLGDGGLPVRPVPGSGGVGDHRCGLGMADWPMAVSAPAAP